MKRFLIAMGLVVLLLQPGSGMPQMNTPEPRSVQDDTVGLIAYWPMDELSGTTLYDASPSHLDGVMHGTSSITGVVNQGRYFNGTGDYIVVASNTMLDFSASQSFTIDLWFKTTGQGISQYGYAQEFLRRGSSGPCGYDLRVSQGGYIQAEVGNGLGGDPPAKVIQITSQSKYNDDQWHHVIFIRDRSSQELYLYIDGVMAAPPVMDDFPLPLANTRPLTIGRWEADAYPEYYPGSLDEVKIFLGAKHPQVTDTNRTVALWHCNESTGTVLHDASGFGNDGTIYNCEWVPGKFGTALHYDGVTSYVKLPNSASLRPSESFTLDAWVSFDTLDLEPMAPPDTAHAVILSNIGPYPYGGGYQLTMMDHSLWFEYRVGGVNGVISRYVRTGRFQLTHHFYHVTAIYQRVNVNGTMMTSLRTFIDGVRQDSALFVEPITYANTPYLYIGTNMTGRSAGGTGVREFPGIIDEIRVWDGVKIPDGYGREAITVEPAHIDFGSVLLQHTEMKVVSISNQSFVTALHIDSMSVDNPHFLVENAPFQLPPGTTRGIQVRYSPTVLGTDSAELKIYVREEIIGTILVPLRGQPVQMKPAPIIHTILDLANDEGRQVRIRWYPSKYDSPGDSLRAAQYSIWRRVADIGDYLNPSKQGAASGSMQNPLDRMRMINGELWDYIATIPASGMDEYSMIVPTLYNATRYQINWTIFMVSVHTTSDEYFFSAPDSGYSVDNSIPWIPANARGTRSSTSISLKWDPVLVPDLLQFVVYRATDLIETPVSSMIIGKTKDTSFVDRAILPNRTYYYVVTAIDSSLNESPASAPVVITPYTGVIGGRGNSPAVYRLEQVSPNPFNPSTWIRYQLPVASRVTLVIYDMLGRVVNRIVDGQQDVGYYTNVWSPKVASGIYFIRMTAVDASDPSNSYSEIQKVLYIR